VTEEPGAGQLAKWKRLFNAVAARQNIMKAGRALIRLVNEVMAPVRFDSPAEFDAVRARVNERLLLSGLGVALLQGPAELGRCWLASQSG
jgi:hypothetical protein